MNFINTCTIIKMYCKYRLQIHIYTHIYIIYFIPPIILRDDNNIQKYKA